MEFITEPTRKVPLIMKADVVVVGGGPAGVGAALRAARNGADTVVIERFGSLGGTNTTGFMFVALEREHLAAEIYDRLRPGGHIVNLLEKFPDLTSNPLTHYSSALNPQSISEILAFDPDMCAFIINEMMEKTGVKLLLRTSYVNTKVEGDTIEAIIVENVSGRQAIAGKVFIDATGRGDVIARSGVPYTSARNEMGFPMPMGLMWKMSDVDYERLFEYQKKDPKLEKLGEKARKKGELPYYRSKKTAKEMKYYDLIYTGHPHLEMSPTSHLGEMLLWMPVIHEWGLDGAEKAEDLTRAEIHIRKQIVRELNFLKKYVPGFEKAYLSGISPYMGIREGRHPIGEYVLTCEDVRNGRKFDDATLRLKTLDYLDMRNQELAQVEFDVPYRCFLPKKIDNLLLAGDDISVDHGAFLHIRSFVRAMNLGEVAGTAATLSVKNETKPKELEYSVLEKTLLEQHILTK